MRHDNKLKRKYSINKTAKIHFSTLTTANKHLRVLRCDLMESQGPSTIIVIRIGMTPTLGAIKFALSL